MITLRPGSLSPLEPIGSPEKQAPSPVERLADIAFFRITMSRPDCSAKGTNTTGSTGSKKGGATGDVSQSLRGESRAYDPLAWPAF